MISAEVAARIRRLFYAEHWRIGTIATELGVHHTTVVRALGREQLVGAVMRRVPSSVLDPYKPFIADVLAQHPRLRATRLHAMLNGRGYPGGVLAVRRYVRTVRPPPCRGVSAPRDAPRRAGAGRLGPLRQDQGRPRAPAARLLRPRALVVARRLRALRPRPVARELPARPRRGLRRAPWGAPHPPLRQSEERRPRARSGDHIRFHPRLLELAGHYHFAPQPCAPYRGNEKGKVERTIQYLRHAFFAARRSSDVADLNRSSPLDRRDGAPSAACPEIRRDGPSRRRSPRSSPGCCRSRSIRFRATLLRAVTSGKTPVRPLRRQRLLDPARARPPAAHPRRRRTHGPRSSTAPPSSRAMPAPTITARSSRTPRTSPRSPP